MGWLPCVVTQVDGASGRITIDVKQGQWLAPDPSFLRPRQQSAHAVPTPLRQRAGSGVFNDNRPFFLGQRLEYHSQTHGTWVACVISELDQVSGNVMIDIKQGQWMTQEQ